MKINYDDYFSYSFFEENETMKVLVGPEDQINFGQYEIILPIIFKNPSIIDGNMSFDLVKELMFKGKIIYALIHKDLKLTSGFLNYHYQKYYEKNGDGYPFLAFMKEVLDDLTELSDKRKYTILEWLDRKKEEKNHAVPVELQTNADLSRKIQWKGTAALFGYLFMELIKKGYIEPELHNGEMSYAGTAKLFFNHFNVNNTTIDNLIKEINPAHDKNTLSPTKRAKFTIPNLSDLA